MRRQKEEWEKLLNDENTDGDAAGEDESEEG